MTRPPFRAVTSALLLSAAALVAAPTPAPGAGKKLKAGEIASARKAVNDHLESIRGDYATVTQIKGADLKKALPDHAFFFVLYRQYPVERVPPKGLQVANVFAWGRDGKLHILTEDKQLEKFFAEKLTVSSPQQFERAARVWLTLAQHFKQDGFYRFVLMRDTRVMKVEDGTVVAAKVVVMAGGNGLIAAQLTFDTAGKLTGVTQEVKLRPGPRPICQATKLLDADPIVRRMAEQALLVMGRPAKPYLDEQRAEASPELRRAIDRLWQRILEADQD